MILSEFLALLVLLISVQSSVDASVIVKREDEGEKNGNRTSDLAVEKTGTEETNLEREILQEISHLNPRKQREILIDLEKQNADFNASQKGLVLSETEKLSPLNVEELKSIRKTIKATNSSLPAIRNKRTLNFLLQALVRAMGYTLTPSNPDAEWLPRQQPPPAQPCSTPLPPCRPNPPSTPPPCPAPPSAPPCPGSGALIQPATIPPSQINPNTISYPYRPARTIPLFNFAPLPAGLRVPYPPLLQPAQQRPPCPPQQPSPPPCGTAPPPPCAAPPPSTPAPCKPPPPPPCTTPAPSPPPCGKAPPPPPPCQTTPTPPCGTTPAPKPPPCPTTPAPPPPCSTPAPSPPPCPPPSPPPCPKPAPPPCGSPAPPPPPPPPPSNPPKKGSILLEYDDPVRIQIFSNDKKYLPASGSIYSGHDEEKKDWHSYFYPENEQSRKKDEDFEEKEEMEEHIEEEDDEEAPGQLKHYEDEDERILANNEEEEEDESETSLSIVKKPAEKEVQKKQKQRQVTSKKKTNDKDKKKEKEDSKSEKTGKSQKMKKPKRKKWIRIVKKQRRKSKTDSNPSNNNNFQIYTSDSFSEASQVAPKYFEKRDSEFAFDSYEKDVSDFDDSSSHSSEDVTQIDLKKVIVNNKEINSPELLREARTYEFNFNPYAPEPEEQRRKKLEKAVERYVEDYVEKQLGNELIKNTGVPKTTVFEFTPKNGPKIQTITTTVAKTTGNPSNFKPKTKPESHYKSPARNSHFLRKSSYEESSKKRGDVSYEEFSTGK